MDNIYIYMLMYMINGCIYDYIILYMYVCTNIETGRVDRWIDDHRLVFSFVPHLRTQNALPPLPLSL